MQIYSQKSEYTLLKDNQKLRCEYCIRYVDAELRGESDLPLHFFFKWNLRHKK